jgi:hypothetical protein
VRGYSVGQACAIFDNADAVQDETQIENLNQELVSLQQQLRNFEVAVEEAKGGKVSGGVHMHVPADTNITCRWAVNEHRKCVDMVISTNNKTVISAVVLMADHIFGGESKVFYPNEPASKVQVRSILVLPAVSFCNNWTRCRSSTKATRPPTSTSRSSLARAAALCTTSSNAATACRSSACLCPSS